MIIFHGSSEIVKVPSVYKGREDIDFGAGFYTTEDKKMAQKWACNKRNSFLNIYNADITSLRVKKLQPNKEWLDYVVANRRLDPDIAPFDDRKYDVIIGPTADDKLFVVVDMYLDGFISADKAIKVINCMHYSDQITFKTQDALDHCVKFEDVKKLYGLEKETLRRAFQNDAKIAAERTRTLLAELNKPSR